MASRKHNSFLSALRALSALLIFTACGNGPHFFSGAPSSADAETTSSHTPIPIASSCKIVDNGYGEAGPDSLSVETVASGLVVPWGISFVSDTEFLVTERPGRVRVFRDGELHETPVLELRPSSRGEAGLLGIALHPRFAETRLFYIYYTVDPSGDESNRVERYRLPEDGSPAVFDKLILGDIPSFRFHDGGRIKFGPDGQLYIATGDAGQADEAQDLESKAGKILRLTPDGEIPPDNPLAGNPVYISGVRNVQGFDWLDSETLVIADHGPTGELGRSGHDEVTIATKGDNLGWPSSWRCDDTPTHKRPFIVWTQALPPGGLLHYTGDLIPQWKGDVLIATLRSEHLQRLDLERTGASFQMISNETYFNGRFGRLREIVQAPDGSIYMTTSNCDGRGRCGSERDLILRLTPPPSSNEAPSTDRGARGPVSEFP